MAFGPWRSFGAAFFVCVTALTCPLKKFLYYNNFSVDGSSSRVYTLFQEVVMDKVAQFEQALKSKPVKYAISKSAERVVRSTFERMEKDDAMQELTVRAYEAVLSNFNPEIAEIEAFITGVVRNHAFDILRKRNGRRGERTRYEFEDIDDNVHVADDRESKLRDQLDANMTLDILSDRACTERERKVVELYRLGYTLEMCANVMRVSRARSYQLLNSAVTRMANQEKTCPAR